MPKKKQSSEQTKRANKSKANLGQREADSQKSGRDRLSHMEANETDQAGQNARSNARPSQGGQRRERERG